MASQAVFLSVSTRENSRDRDVGIRERQRCRSHPAPAPPNRQDGVTTTPTTGAHERASASLTKIYRPGQRTTEALTVRRSTSGPCQHLSVGWAWDAWVSFQCSFDLYRVF